MPRINVEVPDALHRRCKLAAVGKGKTLKQFLIEELDAAL